MMIKDSCGRNNIRGGNQNCANARPSMQGAGGCPICGTARGNARGERHTKEAKWMRRLQVLDFALQELVLYLDMYPECRRALEKYHALKREREQLVNMLQESGIPITAMGNASKDKWAWIDSPWPWEYDFIGNHKD